MTLDISSYDFLDLGAKEGGSLRMATSAFGGRGLGVDINPDNIEKLKAKGFAGLLADATELPLPSDSVSFVQSLHFLEHLPNQAVAEKVIDSAVRVARDFVLVLGPDFGGRDYLKGLGFKKYFADWTGHTWHHTAQQFQTILEKYSAHRWRLIQFDPVRDSNSPVILPLSATPDRHHFEPESETPKEPVTFKPKLFEHLAFAIVKSDKYSAEQILYHAMKPRTVAENSPPGVEQA